MSIIKSFSILSILQLLSICCLKLRMEKPKLNYKSKKRLMCHLLVYSPKQQKKEKRSFNPSMGGRDFWTLIEFRIFSQGIFVFKFSGTNSGANKSSTSFVSHCSGKHFCSVNIPSSRIRRGFSFRTFSLWQNRP